MPLNPYSEGWGLGRRRAPVPAYLQRLMKKAR